MKILLVEDNRVTAEALAILLADSGHVVDVADEPALAALALAAPPPEAIVLDQVMPGLDGLSWLARARRAPEWRAVPVVMLTAVGDAILERLRPAVASLGPARALRKPALPGEILAAIGEMS